MGTMCDMNMRRPLGVWKPRPKELPYRTKTDLPLQLPVNHGDSTTSVQVPMKMKSFLLTSFKLVLYQVIIRGERDRGAEKWDNIPISICPVIIESAASLQIATAIALLTPRVVGASLCDLFPWVSLFFLLLQAIGEHRMFSRNIVLRTVVHP
jgi:hypothetical protein